MRISRYQATCDEDVYSRRFKRLRGQHSTSQGLQGEHSLAISSVIRSCRGTNPTPVQVSQTEHETMRCIEKNPGRMSSEDLPVSAIMRTAT